MDASTALDADDAGYRFWCLFGDCDAGDRRRSQP